MRRCSCTRSGEPGFSLLEALVALAIISAALIPMFQMQSALNNAVARSAVVSERISVGATVLARLSVLNPMKEESGEEWLGGHLFSWESRRLESFTQAASEISAPRTVALFELEYTVTSPAGKMIDKRTVKILGWREEDRQFR